MANEPTCASLNGLCKERCEFGGVLAEGGCGEHRNCCRRPAPPPACTALGGRCRDSCLPFDSDRRNTSLHVATLNGVCNRGEECCAPIARSCGFAGHHATCVSRDACPSGRINGDCGPHEACCRQVTCAALGGRCRDSCNGDHHSAILHVATLDGLCPSRGEECCAPIIAAPSCASLGGQCDARCDFGGVLAESGCGEHERCCRRPAPCAGVCERDIFGRGGCASGRTASGFCGTDKTCCAPLPRCESVQGHCERDRCASGRALTGACASASDVCCSQPPTCGALGGSCSGTPCRSQHADSLVAGTCPSATPHCCSPPRECEGGLGGHCSAAACAGPALDGMCPGSRNCCRDVPCSDAGGACRDSPCRLGGAVVAGVCGQADQHCCAPSTGGGGGGSCTAAGGACMRTCRGGSELPGFSGGCGVGSRCCQLILP